MAKSKKIKILYGEPKAHTGKHYIGSIAENPPLNKESKNVSDSFRSKYTPTVNWGKRTFIGSTGTKN